MITNSLWCTGHTFRKRKTTMMLRDKVLLMPSNGSHMLISACLFLPLLPISFMDSSGVKEIKELDLELQCSFPMASHSLSLWLSFTGGDCLSCNTSTTTTEEVKLAQTQWTLPKKWLPKLRLMELMLKLPPLKPHQHQPPLPIDKRFKKIETFLLDNFQHR